MTLSFSEAIHYCDNLGLQLPVPDSLIDNEKLLDLGLFSFVRQSEKTFIWTNFWKLFKATEKNNYWPLNVPLGILKVGNNWINIYTQDELNFEPKNWENKTESVSGSTVVLNTRAQAGFCVGDKVGDQVVVVKRHPSISSPMFVTNINLKSHCSLNGSVGHLYRMMSRLISFVLLETTEIKISIIVKWK